MKKLLSFFTLFSSLSTLFCCALPVLFVSLGMGATFASLTASFPQIISLMEHKNILFIVTGFLLFFSYFLMKKAEKKACPLEGEKKELCEGSKPWVRKVFLFSLVVFSLGFSFSYILPHFFI